MADTKQKRRFIPEHEGKIGKLVLNESTTVDVYHDKMVRELRLYVGMNTKTYRLLKYKGRQFDELVGRHPDMTLAEARAAAGLMLQEIRMGTYRRAAQGTSMDELTLHEGWQILNEVGELSVNSLKQYETFWRLNLKKFANRSMVELSQQYEEMRLFHLALSKRRSPSVADATMKVVQSIYSKVRDKRYPGLPPAPIQTIEWHGTNVYEPDISRAALAEHFAAVAKHHNPVLRAVNDWLYFTGARVDSVLEMRWEMLDEKGFCIPAEYMKGKKPHFQPLTKELNCILDQVRPFQSEYVFPSLRTNRKIGDYRIEGAWGSRRQRHHFASEAEDVLKSHHASALMAHTIKSSALSSMKGVYVGVADDKLAKSAQKITKHLHKLKQKVTA